MPLGVLARGIFGYNAGISACERAGQWQRALQLLALMPAESLDPGVVSCSDDARGQGRLSIRVESAGRGGVGGWYGAVGLWEMWTVPSLLGEGQAFRSRGRDNTHLQSLLDGGGRLSVLLILYHGFCVDPPHQRTGPSRVFFMLLPEAEDSGQSGLAGLKLGSSKMGLGVLNCPWPTPKRARLNRRERPSGGGGQKMTYCGWTKCCTTKTIVCWYLQGNRLIPGFPRWCEMAMDFASIHMGRNGGRFRDSS